MDEPETIDSLRQKLATAERELNHWRRLAQTAQALWANATVTLGGGVFGDRPPTAVLSAPALAAPAIPETAGSPARDCAVMRLEFPEAKTCALPRWHIGAHATAAGEEFVPSEARADIPLQESAAKEGGS